MYPLLHHKANIIIPHKERLCVSRKFTATLQRDVEKINEDCAEQICGKLKAEGLYISKMQLYLFF
ncbi:MAG: hypothetical protein RSB34_02800 [Muribaculaceae bacterium]